ncbi:MAG: DEAD/DEAH box helicase [Thermoguttaceae bacterium]
MTIFSWFAPPRPAVSGIDLSLRASLSATACGQSLGPPLAPRIHALRLDAPPPRAISIPITTTEVRVRGFFFPVAEQADLPAVPHAAALPAAAAVRPQGSTRIKPPADVIKLQDRLHYLLQPSLESLLAERSLAMPFAPFPFQFEGVAFLYPRHAAVLADEMGLGKTMQAITAIRLLLRRGEVQSVLLVCPKSLVTNWQRELNLWAPEIPVLVIEGDQARRLWQWRLPDVPLRLANYELLCRDRDALDGVGGPCPRFDLVVLDEAQRIKNLAGTTSEVVRSIARRRSWALTGTPVENSADDLVGIFEFLAPGFLSPKMKPRRLGGMVSDHVLRRTKEQVLSDLPPKLFRDAELELTPPQRAAYELAENEGIVRLTSLGGDLTIQHVFELVLRLKQICNFDPAGGASSKLERLEADLEEIAGSGRKAIVFSQWVQTIERLLRPLARFGPLGYHGRIPTRRRDDVIRRFRDDPTAHVLLMSYGAGGVGLNLQFAGYVFLFDRWWNPAVEDQAINRAHRIGVAGPVTVSRFLVLDSIEERIDRILQEKRDLFEAIFAGADRPGKLGLTEQEVFGLFQLKCPRGPIDVAA